MNKINNTSTTNTSTLIQHFESVVPIYDQAAVLSQEVARRMMQRLSLIKLMPACVLELGAATGFASRLLEKQYPKAHIISLDFTHSMLLQAYRLRKSQSRQSFLCGDANKIPLSDHCVDGIFLNLLWRSKQDISIMLRECQRLLKPNGLILFTCYGPDTLKELEKEGEVSQVYPDILTLGSLLQIYFTEPVLDKEYFTLTYRNSEQLRAELEVMGLLNERQIEEAINKGDIKSHRPIISRVSSVFETQPLCSATFEIIYAHAWMVPPQKTIFSKETSYVPLNLVKRSSRL